MAFGFCKAILVNEIVLKLCIFYADNMRMWGRQKVESPTRRWFESEHKAVSFLTTLSSLACIQDSRSGVDTDSAEASTLA